MLQPNKLLIYYRDLQRVWQEDHTQAVLGHPVYGLKIWKTLGKKLNIFTTIIITLHILYSFSPSKVVLFAQYFNLNLH